MAISVARCSHSNNYFFGYSNPKKGNINTDDNNAGKIAGGCGCGGYYIGKEGWVYFVHKDDGTNRHSESYYEGYPRGSKAKDFDNGDIGSLHAASSCRVAIGGKPHKTSCYVRCIGSSYGSRNVVLRNKGLSNKYGGGTWDNKYLQDAKELKDTEADFCPGHNFAGGGEDAISGGGSSSLGQGGNQDEDNTYKDFELVDTDVFAVENVKNRKMSYKIGALNRRYNDYAVGGKYYSHVAYADACNRGRVIDSKGESYNYIATKHTPMNNEDTSEATKMPAGRDDAVALWEQDTDTPFYGHDLRLKASISTHRKGWMVCNLCRRSFPNSYKPDHTDIDLSVLEELKKSYTTNYLHLLKKSAKFSRLSSKDKELFNATYRIHHWVRPEVYGNGDYVKLSSAHNDETNISDIKERQRVAFYPYCVVDKDPWVTYAYCGADSGYMQEATGSLSKDERIGIVADRSYCNHVEFISLNHLIVDYHISNLLDPEPLKYGSFKEPGDTSTVDSMKYGKTTYCKDPERLYKGYLLGDSDTVEYPMVHCAVGKVLESWQTSPLPDDASSDLHEAYAPNGENVKFYATSIPSLSVELIHNIATGLYGYDENTEGVKSPLSLKDSQYALTADKIKPQKDDFDGASGVSRNSYKDSLLTRSVIRSLYTYASSDIKNGHNLFDRAGVEADAHYKGMPNYLKSRDYTLAYMLSQNMIDDTRIQSANGKIPDMGTSVVYGAQYGFKGSDGKFGATNDTFKLDSNFILQKGLYSDKGAQLTNSMLHFGKYIDPSITAQKVLNGGVENTTYFKSMGNINGAVTDSVKNNVKSHPYLAQVTPTVLKVYSHGDDPEWTDYHYLSQYLPKFTEIDSNGDVSSQQFNVQRFAIDALGGQDMGAEALTSPMTVVDLYGNITPLRYVVDHNVNGFDKVSKYVIPAGYTTESVTRNKYTKDVQSHFAIEVDGKDMDVKEYIKKKCNPNKLLYNEYTSTIVEHHEVDENAKMYKVTLPLNGWWYGNHHNDDTGASDGAYNVYGKPKLVDSKNREWYYVDSDKWTLDPDADDSTLSPWATNKETFAFGEKIPSNKDMCSSVNKQAYALSAAPNSAGTDVYGEAALCVDLKPKSYSIRYIVNDKYANAFDKSCPETGKDNYFEDKNYYDGKAHYFDATKDTPVNYHDRNQGTSSNRGTKWKTGGNYPKAYKQGYYLAGWQYYGDDFHEYGTDEGDDKKHPTGFIAAGDKIHAFQYYPKYHSTSKNVAYLYAVWKPYEYTITYKKGAGDSGSDISQKKPFDMFYVADDTGDECYDLFTNTVGTFASTPRRTYTYGGETHDLDIDVNMKSAPHFKKFGYYISSWTGTIGTTNSHTKKIEKGDFKKSKYYGDGRSASWTDEGLNKAYEKPKSGTHYSPDGGTTTQSNAHNTKAKAKYLRIDEDLVIPGDESYNHLPEDIEPRGHNLKITYTAKWSPILYNVVYKQDTDGTNGAVSVGGDIVTGNYQFGKVYSTHKNPKTNDGWSRSTPGGTSIWKGWCFVDKDTGLHPHFTAGNATNVTEVSTSTEESSRGANFYTKSKTQGSWYRGMGQWGTPYTDDHNYGSTAIHGGNKIVEPSGLTYTQYFDYLHDDVDPGVKGKLGSFPLYGVWDDKPGWEPQDLIWSFQKMETLINSNGGRYSTNAMAAVERVFREAEASTAGQGAQDREHNDAVVASNTYTDKANSMRLFEFEKTFEDICKQTFDNRHANTEGRAASTFSLNWYYASTDPTVKPNQTDTTFYRRKLYLTDSDTWRNLQIERKRANGQAVTQNANLPWCQNFYKVDSGRTPMDYASDSLDDNIDKN